MSSPNTVSGRMRSDWDRRAREDACYYAGFGRLQQSREEFFDSAVDVLRILREEFRRFPPGTDFEQLSALEIGCGPGRLMLPLSEVFGRISGVDVSGEMIALAKENLAGVDHADARLNQGSDLAAFEDESIDFCYSFAVFQHIPDTRVVLEYLREGARVLKVEGIFKWQLNGLSGGEPRDDTQPGWSQRAAAPPRAAHRRDTAAPDTWSGVRFRPEEIARFVKKLDLQLLSMDGFDTQYLWMTTRKRTPGWQARLNDSRDARIIGVANTLSPDAAVPCAGRYASGALWVVDLPQEVDLNSLRIEVEGVLTAPSFLAKHAWRGPSQVNFYLPAGVRTGMVPVRLRVLGRPASNTALMRVAPPGPLVPRLVRVSDGTNLLSSVAIESRKIRVRLEEVDAASEAEVNSAFAADIDGHPVELVEPYAVDPLTRLYEFNLTLPDRVATGAHKLTIRLGRRTFPAVEIHVTE